VGLGVGKTEGIGLGAGVGITDGKNVGVCVGDPVAGHSIHVRVIT